MAKLLIVGCCDRKAAHPLPAVALYRSQLFLAAASYAEQSGEDWAIVSAKHGLVMPNDVIDPYDQTLTHDKHAWRALAWRTMAVVQDWAASRDLFERGNFRELITLEVLAGHDYAELLRWPWRRCPRLEVVEPMQGLGIGERLRWLKQANKPNQPRLFA